jgi:hypothetical protein
VDVGSLMTGVAALGAVIVSVWSVVQARRVRRRSEDMEHSKVDAAAYDRARGIYESSILQLERQIEMLTRRLTEVTIEKDKLHGQVFDLQRLTEQLRRTLIANGIRMEGDSL